LFAANDGQANEFPQFKLDLTKFTWQMPKSGLALPSWASSMVYTI